MKSIYQNDRRDVLFIKVVEEFDAFSNAYMAGTEDPKDKIKQLALALESMNRNLDG